MLNKKKLAALLKALQRGERTVEDAYEELTDWAGAVPVVEDIGCAKTDLRRAWRCGCAEVIFAPGKTTAETVRIAKSLKRTTPTVLVTRTTPEQAKALRRAFPGKTHWNERARTVRIGKAAPLPSPTTGKKTRKGGKKAAEPPQVAIVTAGTADRPAAEEALETLAAAEVAAATYFDVGVAGLHRLLSILPELRRARVVIAAAGMEGALPGVIGGLIPGAVVAVPTSTGYGVGAGGFAALASMLNSCAAGVTVVNIDNGFGAAVAALRIIRAPVS